MKSRRFETFWLNAEQYRGRWCHEKTIFGVEYCVGGFVGVGVGDYDCDYGYEGYCAEFDFGVEKKKMMLENDATCLYSPSCLVVMKTDCIYGVGSGFAGVVDDAVGLLRNPSHGQKLRNFQV